jgi:EpsI family protein
MIKKIDVRFTLAALVLCACIGFIYKHSLMAPDEKHTSNNEFPSRILNWVGHEVVYDKGVISSLSPDKIIYKTYHNSAGPPITLFIAYYNALEKADLSHSPIVCFTGQGWEINDATQKEIPINLPEAPKIKVNQVIQKKLDTTMIVLFWYQSGNHAFANRGIQKISLFLDKLLGRPDSNGFVRVTVSVPAERSIEETTSYVYGFIRDLYPEIRGFFL